MSIIESQEPAYREGYEIDVLTKRIEQLKNANRLLRRSERRKMERIEQLESENTELKSLMRDVWRAYSVKADESFHPAWEVDSDLAERMVALGLMGGDE